MSADSPDALKVIGVGLNKTGTKTLRHLLMQRGYAHQSQVASHAEWAQTSLDDLGVLATS